MDEKRWLSIMIATFGVLCLVQSFFCAYIIYNLSISGTFQYLTKNTFNEVVSTQNLLLISFFVYFLSGIFSIVPSIGIFKDKSWGRCIWLFTTLLIIIYVIISLYENPNEWSEYLSVVFLVIYSWYVLWYLPRKKQINA